MRSLAIFFGIIFAILFFACGGLAVCYLLTMTNIIGHPFPASQTFSAQCITGLLIIVAARSLYNAGGFLSGEFKIAY